MCWSEGYLCKASVYWVFTKPFTRFEFIECDEYPDAEKAFCKLQNDIISAGWTTLDLS